MKEQYAVAMVFTKSTQYSLKHYIIDAVSAEEALGKGIAEANKELSSNNGWSLFLYSSKIIKSSIPVPTKGVRGRPRSVSQAIPL